MTLPLRASEWWSYKLPSLYAIAYIAVGFGESPPAWSELAGYFALYTVVLTAMAGFGHFLLDAFDVEEDSLLGKPNLWAGRRPIERVSILLGLVTLVLLPLIWLPVGAAGLIIVALEPVAFALYSMPPIRLKARGLAGVIADATYAHALPALWTWFVFANIAGLRYPIWVPVLIGTLTLMVGARHILQHQVLEEESDRRAAVPTFAVRHGAARARSLVLRGTFPIEVLCLAVVAVILAPGMPVVPVGLGLYLAWHLVRRVSSNRPGQQSPVVSTFLLSRFYEKWLPVIVLAALSLRDPTWLAVMAVHIVLFRGAPRSARGIARYAAAGEPGQQGGG